METSFAGRTTSVGDVVSGKIVKITGEAAFVDYGAKSEGMVHLAELRDDTGALLHDVGATIDLVVAETKGYVRLSFRDAQAGKARVAIKEAWKKQESVRGKVVGTNKGGYEIRIDGVRAFCPLSQLADRFVQDPQSMVGQDSEDIKDAVTGELKNHFRSLLELLEIVVKQQEQEEREQRDVVLEYCRSLGCPAVADFPCGHVADNATLPLGTRVALDADNRTLEILEPSCLPR
jgi:small subunit ribosomal protein S1